MRRLLCLTAALALLVLVGCGGDDEPTTTAASGATGATGTGGAAGAGDLSTGDYLADSIPDQVDAVEQLVESDPACEGVDAAPGGDFQVAVAINAAQASPDTPLAEVVNAQCEEG